MVSVHLSNIYFMFFIGYGVHDLNGHNSTGFMIAQMTQSKGIRMSSARSFLRPARNRSNFHILLNTTVTKILIHPNSKAAQGNILLYVMLSYL